MMSKRPDSLEGQVLFRINQLRRRFNLSRLKQMPNGCTPDCVSPDCSVLTALEAIPNIRLTRSELVADGRKVAELVLLTWYGAASVREWSQIYYPEDREFPVDLPEEVQQYLNGIYPSWGRE